MWGSPVAQWFKRWPTDLSVPGLPPLRQILLKHEQGSIVRSLSLSYAHRPNTAEIMLKGCKIASNTYTKSGHN